MKIKFALALVAAFGFAALPAFAQHGHGGGGSGSSSMHGASHSSGHDANEANDANDDHGGHDGMNENEANEHSGRHGGHDSSHGSLAKLSSNTQLAGKLQALLPPGTNLQQAAQGFKNLGQFVAAVHVSKDLGIPFDQLKAKMTGPGAESLGKAIQQLDPSANAKAALKQAEREAKSDLKSSKPDNDKDDDKNATTTPAS